jgi:hypothetical protein
LNSIKRFLKIYIIIYNSLINAVKLFITFGGEGKTKRIYIRNEIKSGLNSENNGYYSADYIVFSHSIPPLKQNND